MGTPARAFMRMLDKANGLAVGNSTLMVKRIIASVDISPVPLRMVLRSQALSATIDTLEKRLGSFRRQIDITASTDIID